MMMLIVVLSFLIVQVWSQTVIVNTTSGQLSGIQVDGVKSFKGIRFAHPPVKARRWSPPVPFVSSGTHDATTLGPACVQQISAFQEELHNLTVIEDEDCLFLNVWAPESTSGPLKSVIVWIYGGAFVFGTASYPEYDGTSFAKNQDVVFVSFNYRVNVFGFPSSQDLSASHNNFGLLDQELALAWVQDNIAKFGGDKSKVTIMGQSAGSLSVSLAISRRNSTVVPPFRAGIMLSGAQVTTSPKVDFSKFDAFATAMNCTQTPGPLRLHCLRKVSFPTIRAYLNGPLGREFSYAVDNVMAFDDPLERIRTGQFAQVPILLGNMQDDGTTFVYNSTKTLSEYLKDVFGSLAGLVPPALVRALYPGLTDPQVMAAAMRDYQFRCPTKLWSEAFVRCGVKYVHRYTYGAVFADIQPLPDLGAWHSSELPILFGTYNSSTATAAEVELSQTFQTAFANFAKDPVDESPAPNWPRYEPGRFGVESNPTLAKIAYHGNVDPGNFIKPVQPISIDSPCVVWDHFLDYRPSTSEGGNSHGMCMVHKQIGAQGNSSPISPLLVQVSG